MTLTHRRPRSTIVPGRIIIPRLVMAQAGINDNASYLDEPSVRSDESHRSRNEMMMIDDFDAPDAPAPDTPEDVTANPEVDEMADEEPLVEHDVSMAIHSRPTRNRRAPLRWWLLERPVYDRERGFVGISKGSTSSDSEKSETKKTATRRKRTKKNETPAGIGKKIAKKARK